MDEPQNGPNYVRIGGREGAQEAWFGAGSMISK
jgi:hypothetical protein